MCSLPWRERHGDGSVAHLLKTKPKDLVNGTSKHLPDGYLYGTIRDGGSAMPAYADALSIHERWQVVTFVRALQTPRRREQVAPLFRILDLEILVLWNADS